MLNAVPLPIQVELQNILHADLVSFSFVGGGCINHGGKLTTSAGDFFLKWNDASRLPRMFEAEAKGLGLLKKAGVIDVPAVIASGQAGNFQFLVLEYVESKSKHELYWDILGEGLARLHQISDKTFGLDHDNFIGSLPQKNLPTSKWVEFFIENRMEVQLKMAMDSGRISASIGKQFDLLYQKLPSLLPEEKPALLHGDLWSGNLITHNDGKPCIIDPAVYFGNREIELAFTELFGGFSTRFYEAYDENFQRQAGFRGRVELYQLYPLLVHVNLFGGSYVPQTVSILKKFV